MGRPTDAEEAIAFLEGLDPFVVRLGLDRIAAALRALKNPERDYPALHVAGTNGKGSTCAFAASCLRSQGYRVGLYTSPHLVRVNERIQVDGAPISDETLGQRIREVLELFPEARATPPPLSYFELGTLVALWHFAKERVDVAVLETGLGGRLDATTAVSPVVTAITPVALDHTAQLGGTLSAIALEKAGIIKAGVPLVLGPQEEEAQRVLEAEARTRGAPLFVFGRDFSLSPGPDGFVYRGARTALAGLKLGLLGPHQAQNAAVALAMLERLEDRGLAVGEAAVREGLAQARWPGRMELFPGAPEVLLDGAHNPAGARALADALEELFPGRAVHLVFGVFSDKDHRPMLDALLARSASAHLTPVPGPRSLPPSRYARAARARCPRVEVYADPKAALAGAKMAAQEGDLVVAAGSLYLVGALRGLLAGA